MFTQEAKNNYLSSKSQYNIRLKIGFRQKHYTTHAILGLINTVSVSIDNSCHTIGMFLDFTKRLGTIIHYILFYKLRDYGISGKA